MLILAKKHECTEDLYYEHIGIFDSFSNMGKAVGGFSVTDYKRYYYCKLTETNTLFSDVDYIPIPMKTPWELNFEARGSNCLTNCW
jgi:hypothetical protein